MNSMSTLALTIGVVVVAFCGVARADFVSYRDAVKACGLEWKAKAEKSAKGEGQKAWNDFRAKCVVEKGYVKGLKPAKAELPIERNA